MKISSLVIECVETDVFGSTP